MRWFANKNFPYPVLSPCKDAADSDYVGSAFQPLAIFESATRLKVTYPLSEKSLLDLIENGAAQFATEIHCRDTYLRRLHTTSERENTIEFRKGDLHKHVEVSSYVVCIKDIFDHTSERLHSEFGKDAKFNIPQGSVLAVGAPDVFWIDLDLRKRIGTIFEIETSQIQKNKFAVDLDNEKIKILMNEENRGLFQSLQDNTKMFPSLLSSVYLAALMEALRQIADEHSQHREKIWAKSIEQSIADMNRSLNDKSDFLEIAQELLKCPVSSMLQQEERHAKR